MDIALDIGGTKLAAAKVRRGEIVEQRTTPTPGDDPDALIRALVELCDGWISEARMISSAVTGVVRDGHVVAVNKAIISNWHGYPLQRRLAACFGADKTYRFLNDAVAACWGEYLARQLRPPSMVYLTISTGVGGGMVIHGRPVIGANYKAGHFGHIQVASTPLCGCGRRGCVEALASGRAISEQASALLKRTVDAKWVFDELERMPELMAIIDGSAKAIARLLDGLDMIVDAGLVVIGGGVGLAPGYLDRVRKAIGADQTFAIEPALLGADSGLVGAAKWVTASIDTDRSP
ncbi:MAG: ROK family protein [Geminicoccales bacterium]